MGTALCNIRGKDLYAFWGDLLRDALLERLAMAQEAVIVNLASEEYAKSAKLASLPYPVITPVFQDEKAGKFKVISFYAKKARGRMVRYAAEQAVTQVATLKAFAEEGYAYCESCSTAEKWVFRRAESDEG
jgi:cytoplasmic iron level regulating protein YaaA (DUF328/UPF0246 family)